MTRVIEGTIERLFYRQPTLVHFTSDSGQTEWNLAHHLANELQRCAILSHFHCDLEVTKGRAENKRPDIIFHSRGTHENNFLVIEMKRGGGFTDIELDRDKIKSFWFSAPYRYKFGCTINIRSDRRTTVEVIENV